MAIWLVGSLPIDLIFAFSSPRSTFLAYTTGAMHAVLLCSFPAVLLLVFLVSEKEAIWLLRGAWGEDFTRDELKHAQQRGLIWGWVDSIELAVGDIDHLVVTRSGGVVAIDTKYRSSNRGADWHSMALDARRSAVRATGALHTVLPRATRGRRRAPETPNLNVAPLVVVWGPAGQALPPQAQLEGVAFVAGPELQKHLAALADEAVDEVVAAEMLSLLREFRRVRSTSELTSTHPPTK